MCVCVCVGGEFATSRKFFCYCSKTVGARLLKLCGFYCWPLTHHLRGVSEHLMNRFITLKAYCANKLRERKRFSVSEFDKVGIREKKAPKVCWRNAKLASSNMSKKKNFFT